MSTFYSPTKCGYCEIESDDLKSCSKCHLTPYCSKQCQRDDWQRHRQWCELIQGNTPTPDSDKDSGANYPSPGESPTQGKKKRRKKKASARETPPDQTFKCTWCKKGVANVLRCSRCKETVYCSDTCQRRDWLAGHQKECEPPGRGLSIGQQSTIKEAVNVNGALINGKDTEEEKEDLSNVCDWCQKYVDSPLRCKGCEKAKYCSEACQRKDWSRQHDAQCARDKSATRDDSTRAAPSETTDEEGELSKVCDWCQKCLDSPLRCTGCGKATYCSEKCQKKDWSRNHKTKCDKSKIRSKRKNGLDTKTSAKDVSKPEDEIRPVSCNWCQKFVEDPLPCQGCTKIIYCSAECQKKDWLREHQKVCKGKENRKGNIKSSNTVSEADSEAASKDSCRSCKKKTKDVKKCARCKITLYCSKSCQRQDWARHKEECVTVDGVIKTKEFRKAEQAEAERERQIPMSRMELLAHMMGVFGQPEAAMRPGMTWEEARRVTQLRFPGFKIVENFNDLPGEFLWMVPVTYDKVLLTYIARQHPYFARHAVYIRDNFRQETFVMFYLDYDNPRPYFSWSQVVPGNYICIRNAIFHHFLDGTVGIRVDDAADVKIL